MKVRAMDLPLASTAEILCIENVDHQKNGRELLPEIRKTAQPARNTFNQAKLMYVGDSMSHSESVVSRMSHK